MSVFMDVADINVLLLLPEFFKLMWNYIPKYACYQCKSDARNGLVEAKDIGTCALYSIPYAVCQAA